MTAEMIIQAAQAKGLKYEKNVLMDLSDGDDKFIKYEIGVEYRNYIWGWFTYLNTEDNWACFRNAYNQATGCEDKTSRRGFAIKRQLEKGLDLWNTAK
ncbi:MAG: hypothetical protein R3Y49_06715 [Rikenellaceae bacterium]